ncbi:chymotrypsin-like protease CTRL-1 isoform X1 [Drosophila subpulchrella]|uniref:chymotrypsin-like protease CTRL-1 isoform X1 n=1 Tax=Drosophila subpulchrella TaxID=1486046 RepID=UPI0018A1B195|nr:chymotrypsin-like protease CTRL-1 isoform X1 [Drosophila subpulchrella]
MQVMGTGAVRLLLLLTLGCVKVLGQPYLLDPQCVSARSEPGHYRVINGRAADLLSNPWMVIIIERGMMKCGGSLIAPRYVLTAAHCRSETNRQLTVRLGEYDVNQPFDCTNYGCIPRPKEINVTRTFVHGHFNDFHSNDIALLRLETAVQYGEHIRPICMVMGDSNWSRNILKNILQFNTTGWGRTEARTNSPVLQQTSLTHYSLSYCSQYFGRQMDHTHICVGSSTSSTCSGDSGGPLTARLQFGREKRVILFGVVSYGPGHCFGPTVFTNVLPYSSWIEWHTKNN